MSCKAGASWYNSVMNNYGVSGMRVEVADMRIENEGTLTRVCAAVYQGSEEVVCSEWFEVERIPRNERSDEYEDPAYEDAVSEAAASAENRLVDKLVTDHGITDDQARSIVEQHLDVSEMPLVR